ncbi:MAG: MlaD family protein [Bacteroidia bacterium]
MKLKKEVKAGIIIVCALAMLIYGLNYLKGINMFSPNKKLYAIYNNVEGLLPSNPVLVNGFHVGLVEDIQLEKNTSGKVSITMLITDNDVKIPKGAIARITSDFFGNRAIQLDFTNCINNPPVKDKDTLAGLMDMTLKDEVSAQVLPLKNKTEELIVSIDSTMGIIKGVFSKKTQNNLTQSIESINISLKHFETMSGNLDDLVATQKVRVSDILGKIDEIATTIAKNNKQLGNAINNVSSISDSLARSNLKSTINYADSTLYYTAKIFEKINRGKGSLGMLANDTTLYNRLDSTSSRINELLEQMKLHPKKYFHVTVF